MTNKQTTRDRSEGKGRHARTQAKKKGQAVLKADNPTTTRPVAQNGGKNYKFAIINNCVRC